MRPEVLNSRAAWDFIRKEIGLVEIIPESVTRIDFAEIYDGDITGGEHSLVNKGLEDARKAAVRALEDLTNLGK